MIRGEDDSMPVMSQAAPRPKDEADPDDVLEHSRSGPLLTQRLAGSLSRLIFPSRIVVPRLPPDFGRRAALGDTVGDQLADAFEAQLADTGGERTADTTTEQRAADLRGADLSMANLEGADLSGADLSGANLRGAQITPDQLAQAKALTGATLPDGTKKQ
jgi:hypothetical protein